MSGVEVQAEKYAGGLPAGLDPPVEPLPFLYLSTGAETRFTNLLDPEPRSRRIFQLHQPGTLAEWLAAETLDAWVKGHGGFTAADATRPSSLRARLRAMPSVEKAFLYPNQLRAVIQLEQSLALNRPRALVQMATGSLKWAFEGKLADQDPNDEPASVLLDRIKAERAAAPAGKNGGRRSQRRGRRDTGQEPC